MNKSKIIEIKKLQTTSSNGEVLNIIYTHKEVESIGVEFIGKLQKEYRKNEHIINLDIYVDCDETSLKNPLSITLQNLISVVKNNLISISDYQNEYAYKSTHSGVGSSIKKSKVDEFILKYIENGYILYDAILNECREEYQQNIDWLFKK